jgi:hypothetical protein
MKRKKPIFLDFDCSVEINDNDDGGCGGGDGGGDDDWNQIWMHAYFKGRGTDWGSSRICIA